MNAPATLLLNIQNSLANHQSEYLNGSKERQASVPVCNLSFYSPYWVDNRTNMDLVLQDHASAVGSPLLMSYKLPAQFTEVLSPGLPQRQQNASCDCA